MNERIRKLLERLEKVEELLGQPEVLADQKQFRALAQEHSYLVEVKEAWQRLLQVQKELEENQLLVKTEKDPNFVEVIREEILSLEAELAATQKKIENLLVPPDPRDSRSIIIEVRAGTGGDEAALFVGDCVRMYKAYADKKGWRHELFSCAESEMGGFKEYVMVLSGLNVFRLMQHEAGTHRVQRVPETEAQGRVHTSAITVAVLLEPEKTRKSTSMKKI